MKQQTHPSSIRVGEFGKIVQCTTCNSGVKSVTYILKRERERKGRGSRNQTSSIFFFRNQTSIYSVIVRGYSQLGHNILLSVFTHLYKSLKYHEISSSWLRYFISVFYFFIYIFLGKYEELMYCRKHVEDLCILSIMLLIYVLLTIIMLRK